MAIEFGKQFDTIGFDVSDAKVETYRRLEDPAGEISSDELKASTLLTCTTDASQIAAAAFVVIAVPTPVDNVNNPDFTPLVKASETVGRHLRKGAVVVYESTIYPGATEEICIPIVERESGLKWRRDAFAEYSPGRINPGDKQRTVGRVQKLPQRQVFSARNA